MSSPDSFRDIGTLAGGGQPDAPHLSTSTLVEQRDQRAADVGAAVDRPRPSRDGAGPTTTRAPLADDGVAQRGTTRRGEPETFRRRAEHLGGPLEIDNPTEGGLTLL